VSIPIGDVVVDSLPDLATILLTDGRKTAGTILEYVAGDHLTLLFSDNVKLRLEPALIKATTFSKRASAAAPVPAQATPATRALVAPTPSALAPIISVQRAAPPVQATPPTAATKAESPSPRIVVTLASGEEIKGALGEHIPGDHLTLLRDDGTHLTLTSSQYRSVLNEYTVHFDRSAEFKTEPLRLFRWRLDSVDPNCPRCRREKVYDLLCEAPCELRMTSAPQSLAIGAGEYEYRRPLSQPVLLRENSKLLGAINDRTPLKILGWPLALGGLIAGGFGIGAMEDDDTVPIGVVGIITGVAAVVGGLYMAFLDSAAASADIVPE
jgi:hypothetical protein